MTREGKMLVDVRKWSLLNVKMRLRERKRADEVKTEKIARKRMKLVTEEKAQVSTKATGVQNACLLGFMRNRCIETAVVTSYVNPVWMETLVFYPVLLCGSVRNLRTNPPPIIVEVRSDELNKSEAFLGRFVAMPFTCCAHHGRPSARWFSLQFPGGATRGALLASFELFLHDRNQECSVPPRPANKNSLSNRYSADSSICPLFGQYTVHIVCLGIRDYVSCSRLSAMQRAYVEVRIGDRVGRTETLRHLKVNPNFARPVLTLDNVALPRQLCYAPPLTFSLHQLSPFPFASAVAVCEVTSFAKYFRKVPQVWNV
uniref:C2 domain-containing protein n=1 Tax=Parascaris univalens TaxID=6257 RepID=A0A914ZZZ4_PARUN